MRRKMVAALVAGVLIGVALPFVVGKGEAQAQPQAKKTVWEYKTIHYGPIPQGPQAVWPPYDPSGQLNPLGADGWELVSSTLYHNIEAQQDVILLVFKKPVE